MAKNRKGAKRNSGSSSSNNIKSEVVVEETKNQEVVDESTETKEVEVKSEETSTHVENTSTSEEVTSEETPTTEEESTSEEVPTTEEDTTYEEYTTEEESTSEETLTNDEESPTEETEVSNEEEDESDFEEDYDEEGDEEEYDGDEEEYDEEGEYYDDGYAEEPQEDDIPVITPEPLKHRDGSKKKKKLSKSERKRNSKFTKIGCGILIVVIIIVAFMFKAKNSDNETLVSVTDTLLTQQVGKFRYVIDVRTSEADGSSEEVTTSETSGVEELNDIESVEDEKSSTESTDEGVETTSEGAIEETESTETTETEVSNLETSNTTNNDKFSDWSEKGNVEVVNWKYPNYKLTFEGCVKSTDPLEMQVNIGLATNYFNDSLTDIIIKDNKTYINIEQLRYWLLGSRDGNLVELGSSLPESAKYVEYEGDDFSLFSNYAENSEIDASRYNSVLIGYNRFLTAEKTIIPQLTINDDCLYSTDGVYNLDMRDENSVDFLNSVKKAVANVGDAHKAIINNQHNNGFLTDEQYEQAKNETDNVYSAFSEMNKFLSTADLSKMNFVMNGTARKYTGGSGSDIYESQLGFEFDANNTHYLFHFNVQKDSAVDEIQKPIQSTISISNFENKDFVNKTILGVLEHLNVTGVSLEKKLEVTPDSIKNDTLDSFSKLVNSVNDKEEGFTPISKNNAADFISTYRGYRVTDESTNLDVKNATIVEDFLKAFRDVVPASNSVVDENVDTKPEDVTRFPSIIADNQKFRIYADFDLDNSNTRCVQVKCYILNKTDKTLKLKSNDFTLRTMQSSRYPANYQSLLREYDNDFDMEKAPEELVIGKNGYLETSLYFIVQTGIEYMDFWYQESNLGVLISY